MLATIKYLKENYQFDLSKPLDISIPLRGGKENINAWYLPPPEIEPVKDGDFTGTVKAGASTNFNSVKFNPHSHVTHTECLGHITEDFFSVNQLLKQHFFLAELITLVPGKLNNDFVITKKQIENALKGPEVEAVIIRTLPNTREKLSANYSNSNPPYLLEGAATYLKDRGVKHLLIDLPSVDKEKDEGRLAAHKAFWGIPEKPRQDATITEFIFVPNDIEDGLYFLNLQPAPFENDASPSKPILYKIIS